MPVEGERVEPSVSASQPGFDMLRYATGATQQHLHHKPLQLRVGL
jgi:hypothetical protein